MVRPGVAESHVAQVRPVRNGFEFCLPLLPIDLEYAVHFFRGKHVLQDRLVMRPACELLRRDVLGDEHFLHEVRYRHPGLRRARIQVRSRQEVLPGDPFRLLPCQPLRARSRADPRRFAVHRAFAPAQSPETILQIKVAALLEPRSFHATCHSMRLRLPVSKRAIPRAWDSPPPSR